MSEYSTFQKVFTYDIRGVDFTVTVWGTEGEAGSFRGMVGVSNGAPIFNSFMFGDDNADGFQFKLAQPNKPLSLTGIRFEGQIVDWDGGRVINPLGTGTPTTGLEADDFEFGIAVDSFDDIDLLGIHAVNSRNGRLIKLVDDGEIVNMKEGSYVPSEYFSKPSSITMVFGNSISDMNGDNYTSIRFGIGSAAPYYDADQYVDIFIAHLNSQGLNVTEDDLLGMIVNGDMSRGLYYAYGENDDDGEIYDPKPVGLNDIEDVYVSARAINYEEWV